tara:strand:+ start:479 stop:1000 length:522 start_codon:yes stop_codon:yes gene_type:complete
MKRNYESGVSSTPTMFTGIEVEKTPAYGMQTLFVDGIQDTETIMHYYNEHKCTHIFFGANHSYNPKEAGEFDAWDKYVLEFVKEGYLCSLDIPSTINLEWVLEGGLIEYENFIPQIRVVVPYVKQWNYNTMIKIDDKDFKASNPGVWCHSLHDLMDRNKFTDWTKYGLDKVIK